MTGRAGASTTAPRGKALPRVRQILSILAREYRSPKCALTHSTPLELIVATVLSAQCTDARVNQVTPALFRKYRAAADYADAPPEGLEEDIRPTGFYRNKARALRKLGTALVRDHKGEVPRTMEQLVALPGVGRKTANLVLAEAFGIPGLVVDTHVKRMAQRLGLTRRSHADHIERDLMQVIPRVAWNRFSLRLIQHGRAVCKARRPRCEECILLRVCPEGLSRV